MADDRPSELDFMDLYEKFYGPLQLDGTRQGGLDNGLKAQLRRVTEPEDLRGTPAFYRLFNEARPRVSLLRVVFLLPWCDDCGDAARPSTSRFGRLLFEEGISELRLFQVVRSRSPLDVIQLQRLAKMLKQKHRRVDWKGFSKLLYWSEPDGSWSRKSKRQLIEDYFIAQPASANRQEAIHEQ